MWRLALEGTFPGIPVSPRSVRFCPHTTAHNTLQSIIVQFTSLKGSAVRGSAATGLYKHCRYEAQLQHFRLEFHCLLLEPGNIAHLPPGAYVAECQVIGSKEFEAAQALLSIAGNYSSYCSAVCATPPTNAIGQAIAQPPVINRPANAASFIASPATPAANDSIVVEIVERETAQKWGSSTGNSVVVHVVSRDNSGGEGPPTDAQVLVKAEPEGETGIAQDGQLQQSGRNVDLVSYCDSVVRGDRGQGEAGVICEESSAAALCKKRAFTETASEEERKHKESRHVVSNAAM